MRELDEIDIKLIREVEGNMPIQQDPFAEIADRLGYKKSRVMNRIKDLKKDGFLKRIGAILHHRDAGYKANGMFVCKVPDKRIEELGRKLTALSSVSHCYQRRTTPEFDYNLYGMIHGGSQQTVKDIASSFVKKNMIKKYEVLFSTEELKKISLKYSRLIEEK
mgnify:FL=1